MSQVISKENAEHYKWGENCDGWHLVKSPRLSVIQECMPSGCSETRHFHQQAEQFFFILSGKATIEINGKVYTIGEQQGAYVPAGLPHQLRNEYGSDLIFTVTSTPPSHNDRIEL